MWELIYTGLERCWEGEGNRDGEDRNEKRGIKTRNHVALGRSWEGEGNRDGED